ncbi:MAG TPA: tetratricopeptide repeat protein [Chthoniobacterales bacterium]|nr:tetratricopeptide repeat protein [Chthoniobacterales bacterium]
MSDVNFSGPLAAGVWMDNQHLSSPLLVTTAHEAERTGNFDIAASAWREVRLRIPESTEGFTFGGRVLKRMGQISEALSVFGEGLDRFPNNESLAVEQAWALFELGDYGTAANRWRNIRQVFPNNLDGYLGGGLALRRANDHKSADEVYEAALTAFPNNVHVLTELAWTGEESADIPEAIRRWQTLRSRFPDIEIGYVRAGVLLLNSECWDDADAVLAEAAQRFPDSVDAVTSFAWVAHNRRDWPAAIKRWEKVLDRFPQLRDPRRLAAQVLMEMGRFEEATSVLSPAIRMFPDDPDILVLSGWLATRRRDIDAAEGIWASVRQRFPQSVDGYFGYALALREVGRLSEAEAILMDAAQRFPDNSIIAMDLARITELRKNWRLASARWHQVVAQFPNLPDAYVGLGNSLASEGNLQEAEATYSAGAKRFPDEVSLGAAQARLAETANDRNSALAQWKTLQQRFPNSPLGFIGFGQALRDLGELRLSTDALSEALLRFPGNLELEVQLALTLSERKEWISALSQWESLKRRYPNNSHVRWGIAQILHKALGDQAANIAAFTIPSTILSAGVDESEHIKSLSSLFKRFESLGDTCEFGMIQRIFQADQVSLLRWSATSPGNLVKALNARLRGVGDPEHTIIAINGDEYTTEDRRYLMHSHTFTSPAVEPMEFFAPEQCRRIQWLRSRLLDNLTAASKIFIYKYEDGLTESDMNSLYDALCQYCPQIALLCVKIEEPGRPSGTVERLHAGLFVGYIDKFSTVDISVNAWIALCQRTAAYFPAGVNRVEIE